MASARQKQVSKTIRTRLSSELALKRRLDRFYTALAKKYENAYKEHHLDGVLSAITNSEDELFSILLDQNKKLAGAVGSQQANFLLKHHPHKLHIKISNQDIESDLETFLLNRANRSVYLISQTERATVADIISRGIKEGLGIGEIAENIRKSTAGIRGKSIASTIARTETGIVGSHAQNRGAEIAQAQGIEMNKQWIAVDDARTRNSHNNVDNEIVKMDELFIVGGEPMEHPHDLTASAKNVINCRCVVSYIPSDI